MSEADGKGTILIVDDRVENRYVLARILQRAGYCISEERNGECALTAAAKRPDLIILDVQLPDMLGYEVSKRLRANTLTADIPILHISASFQSSESKVQALDSGADGYLVQPVEPSVLIATVRSLLRLKRVESLLRLSSQEWQSTFDALSEGIALLDANQQVLRCNRAFAEMLGGELNTLMGRSIRSVIQERWKVEFQLRKPAMRTRQSEEVKAGAKWYFLASEPLLEKEAVTGFVLIVQDITDRKAAEDALRVTEKLAAAGRLANIIAHEINNPLEAVTNLLYLLQHQELDEASQGMVKLAAAEIERIGRITKQTLAFARESGAPELVSLKGIIEELLQLYKPMIQAQELNVVRQFKFAGNIRGFPGELRQLFTNLLFNAMEATPKRGVVTVRIRRSTDWKGPGPPGARVTLCDSGEGMPPEVRKRIFEPFYTTKKLKGSGLGLYLALNTVNKHGGRITVRANCTGARRGTCFSVFLPEAQPTIVERVSDQAVAAS